LLEADLLRWLEERGLEAWPFLAVEALLAAEPFLAVEARLAVEALLAAEPFLAVAWVEPRREAFELRREAFEAVRLDPPPPEALEPFRPELPDVRPRLVALDWLRADARFDVPR
jgi:hypothetical protein